VKLICACLLVVAVFCLGNGCRAQQPSLGPTDLDGLYQLATEATPSVQKHRRVHKRAKTEAAEQRPASESKLTSWQEEEARQHADDDRLRRKLNICRNCTVPKDKGKLMGF
jgi:hypothetical protein